MLTSNNGIFCFSNDEALLSQNYWMNETPMALNFLP